MGHHHPADHRHPRCGDDHRHARLPRIPDGRIAQISTNANKLAAESRTCYK
jgi:hypothetical protein